MPGKVAVVFGGDGFLGRHLVSRLARAGWRVRVAVRRPQRAIFLQPLGDVGQIVAVPVDVGHPELVRAATARASLVVNLVGTIFPSGRQSFERLHVDGAANVARAAAEQGAERLIHVSALGADPRSASRYARTKAAGEAAVSAAFPAATILRPSAMFGPEDDFFNRFARMALFLPALPVIVRGDSGPLGGPRFQPVYVGDVAAAIMAAWADPGTAGKTFELGGPEVMTMREIVELVLEVTGRHRLLVPLPLRLARLQAAILGLLPWPILTVDQVRLMESDSVVVPGAAGFETLGIAPAAPEVVVPSYLSAWRDPERRPAV